MNTRMDCTKLNIGVYCLAPYARTEAHIKDLADCGINLVICMDDDRATLDLLEKYHIGAIIDNAMPGWWGGDGTNAGTMEQTNPFDTYVKAAENFQDHPAIWGVSTGDEPSAMDFTYYGKIIDFAEKNYKNQFAYLNLYPNYALNPKGDKEEIQKGLRTASYEEYIEAYCKNIVTNYICFDYYMYAATVTGAYDSMNTVANACRRIGRSMWIVLQANSYDPNVFTSENQLRFQAYLAMAFGAECIFWACYTAGWWYNQVLDSTGNKTEQYEKLKRVNQELNTIGSIYMQYRCVDTYFVGNNRDVCDFCLDDEKQCESLSIGVAEDLHAENGALLIVGQMKHRKDKDIPDAFMICAADDPYDLHNQGNVISFRTDAKNVKLYTGTGSVLLYAGSDNVYHFKLLSCHGALLVAES